MRKITILGILVFAILLASSQADYAYSYPSNYSSETQAIKLVNAEIYGDCYITGKDAVEKYNIIKPVRVNPEKIKVIGTIYPLEKLGNYYIKIGKIEVCIEKSPSEVEPSETRAVLVKTLVEKLRTKAAYIGADIVYVTQIKISIIKGTETITVYQELDVNELPRRR